MKTRITTCLIVCLGLVAQAQSKLQDFFDSNDASVTWLGVDYSKARYIGDLGTLSPYEVRRYFNRINDLILSEPEKFDLNRAFQKYNVDIEVDHVMDRNAATNTREIITRSSRAYRMTTDSVQQIIESYQFPRSASGLGVVFIAEVFDKNRELASFYVACIDMKTKSVVFMEKVTGEAGGFGFRNHWGNCIHEVLEEMDRHLFRAWKRKYLTNS